MARLVSAYASSESRLSAAYYRCSPAEFGRQFEFFCKFIRMALAARYWRMLRDMPAKGRRVQQRPELVSTGEIKGDGRESLIAYQGLRSSAKRSGSLDALPLESRRPACDLAWMG